MTRARILGQREVAGMIIAWHDGETLCVRTPLKLQRTQEAVLRKMGFRYDEGAGYWRGSTKSRDSVIIQYVAEWGGMLLCRDVAEDRAFEEATEVAQHHQLPSIMVKHRGSFYVLGGRHD